MQPGSFIKQHQRGYTLIELVIGAFIGVIVLGSIFAIYVPSLESYKKVNAMSVIQETERFAVSVLNTAVQQAGYFGCNSSTEDVAYVNTFDYTASGVSDNMENWAYDNVAVQGYTANSSAIAAVFGSDFNDDLLADGSNKVGDVLMLTSGRDSNLVIDSHDAAGETIDFKGNQTSELKKGMILQLNNCENQAVAFQIDESTDPVYNSTDDVTTVDYSASRTNNCTAYIDDPDNPGSSIDSGKVYLGGTVGASCKDTTSRGLFSPVVYREYLTGTQSRSTAFFLRADNSNKGIPTLYRLSTDGTSALAEPLLAGVENFRVLYGRDTSGNGAVDTYSNAATLNATPARWASVRTIKITLLVRSLTGKGESDQVQNFAFPKTDGLMVNCSSSSPDAGACPGFLFTDYQARTNARRVVEKVFSVRNSFL